MVENGKNREPENWSGMRPHEEFLELCAVATTGEISEEEQKRLRDHLARCPECRQALSEFEAVVDVGVPFMAPELTVRPSSEPRSAPEELVETATAPTAGQMEAPPPPPSAAEQSKLWGFVRRNGHGRTPLNWNYVWLSFAAAVVLTVALGIYSYQVGQHRGMEVARVAPSSADPQIALLEQQLSDVGHERETLRTQLAEQDRVMADFRRQIERQSASLAEMKSAQAALEKTVQGDEAEKQRVAQERSTLNQNLAAAQAAVQKTQSELDSIRQQRSQDQLRVTSLEGQIGDLNAQLQARDEQNKNLNAQLQDREQTLDRQGELLAHDRDIRELMGARDLYIAEVYDVGRDGSTQKPYGRVFYTKGKSLIFYAYDLDQQPGVRNASTFQAWGRRGPDKQQALSLGIFYEDNLAKKRWVLKFDDPRSLDQIDAVFVTLEPNGGSHKPSGKPLLFAYLKVAPNHP